MDWVLRVHDERKDRWADWTTGNLEDCLSDMFDLSGHFSTNPYDELQLVLKRPAEEIRADQVEWMPENRVMGHALEHSTRDPSTGTVRFELR
jgi:hypothetical protein